MIHIELTSIRDMCFGPSLQSQFVDRGLEIEQLKNWQLENLRLELHLRLELDLRLELNLWLELH